MYSRALSSHVPVHHIVESFVDGISHRQVMNYSLKRFRDDRTLLAEANGLTFLVIYALVC